MTISSYIRLKVIGTGSKIAPKSFIIETTTNKYLFNPGEYTQRILSEHNVSNTLDIFFTNSQWSSFSGLLGVCLMIKSNINKKFSIHGPEFSDKILKLLRAFSDSATPFEYDCNPIVEKGHEDTQFSIKCFQFGQSYAYIFRPFKLPPKIDLEKCRALGISEKILKSPVMREFKEGRSITLDDGRVIEPLQVTYIPENSKNFLILDCPDEKNITTYLENKQLLNYLKSLEETDKHTKELGLIIHLLPKGLFNSPTYQSLVEKIISSATSTADNVHQLIFDEEATTPAFISHYMSSIVLNRLVDEKAYPIPKSIEDFSGDFKIENEKIVHAVPGVILTIRPKMNYNLDEIQKIDEDLFLKNCLEIGQDMDSFMKNLDEEKSKLIETTTPTVDLKWPKIIFFGTASSIPNRYRNISGILVRINESESILFDPGEGTLQQFYSFFGINEESERILKSIKTIFISHMHYDHHGGVFNLLKERHSILSKPDPVNVIGPNVFYNWYKCLVEIFPNTFPSSIFNFISINDNFVRSENLYQPDPCSKLIKSISSTCVANPKAIKVPHTGNSFAFMVDLKTGERTKSYRLVYSGDTPKYDLFAKYCPDVDLLIHEATFCDLYREEAESKRHSTVNDVLSVANDMKVGQVIMTHFSQRYPKLPNFHRHIPNVIPAFDFLSVSPCDITRLASLVPLYQHIYPKHFKNREILSEKTKNKRKSVTKNSGNSPNAKMMKNILDIIKK